MTDASPWMGGADESMGRLTTAACPSREMNPESPKSSKWVQQAGLGADAVDDVIRVGGQFADQGAEKPGDALDRQEARDIRPPALRRFLVGAGRDHHVRASAHGCLVVADRDAPAGAGDGQRRRTGVRVPRGFFDEDVEEQLVVGGEAGGQVAGRDEDLFPGPVLVGVVGHGSSGGIEVREAERGLNYARVEAASL
ncbi:hypothetical protein [Streptomyces sp. NPDC054874]